MPTLPTPTTLRARSTIRNSSSRWRRSSCSVCAVLPEQLVDHALELLELDPASWAQVGRSGRSAAGPTTMRGSPSTSLRQLRERLAGCPSSWPSRRPSPRLAACGLACSSCADVASIVSTSRRAYQTSRLRSLGESAHRTRGRRGRCSAPPWLRCASREVAVTARRSRSSPRGASRPTRTGRAASRRSR